MRLKILDIKHTGHHGTHGKSKIGYKYDERRGKDESRHAQQHYLHASNHQSTEQYPGGRNFSEGYRPDK